MPPHVREELHRLIDGLPPNFRKPNAGDMFGALLLEARKAAAQLPVQLTAYHEVKDAWTETGEERLPD